MRRTIRIAWPAVLAAVLVAACSSGGSGRDASPTPSDDPSLAALVPSSGGLDPAFSPTVGTYALDVASATTTLSITATASAAGATLSVRDGAGGSFDPVASGSAAALTVPVPGASSTVTIRVTAPDGTTTRDYTIVVSVAAGGSITVYSIGDSTMADYAVTTQAGWCQELPQFLTGGATLVNRARNGRSSKSFDAEGLWTAVKTQLRPGDYVFIQFGHNDEKADGLEGDPAVNVTTAIGTAAWGGYHDHLTRYVREARALGAHPVLFTPIVRRYFSGATLTAIAQHDLTGNGVAEGNASYPEAMKDVGALEDVPVIDLTASTRSLVEEYGPGDSKTYIYIATDDTHLQPLGATMVAQLAAAELVSRGILTAYLDPAADLVVSPGALSFGSVYTTSTSTLPITVTGLSLSPPAGAVTVAAPDAFGVSTAAGGPFSASLQLPYASGRLAPTKVYVRFAPTAAQAFSGDVTLTPTGGAAKTVALSGAGLTPASGDEALAVWALTADPSCTASGAARCDAETISGLMAASYAQPATTTFWVSDTGATLTPPSNLTQRLIPPSGSWTYGETALVADRYVELAVSTASGTLTVDEISFWAGGAGGSNLWYQVRYSTEDDFSSPTDLVVATQSAKNTITFRDLPAAIVLAPGKTLRIRFHPWWSANTGGLTGKYLCLEDVHIHGWVE